MSIIYFNICKICHNQFYMTNPEKKICRKCEMKVDKNK